VDVAGHASLNLAVNLSMRQFREKELGCDHRQGCCRNRLDARRLDSISAKHAGCRRAVPAVVCGELKALGLQLVLDDFGTACLSLSHLKRFRSTASDRECFRPGYSGNSGDARIVAGHHRHGPQPELAWPPRRGKRAAGGVSGERLCDEMQGAISANPVAGSRRAVVASRDSNARAPQAIDQAGVQGVKKGRGVIPAFFHGLRTLR